MGTFIVDGKSVQCNRTQNGIKAVTEGDIKLSARQRQFWLVVDKTDELNQKICAQLSERIDIKALIKAGLLEAKNTLNLEADSLKNAVATKTIEQQQIIMAAVLHEKSFA